MKEQYFNYQNTQFGIYMRGAVRVVEEAHALLEWGSCSWVIAILDGYVLSYWCGFFTHDDGHIQFWCRSKSEALKKSIYTAFLLSVRIYIVYEYFIEMTKGVSYIKITNLCHLEFYLWDITEHQTNYIVVLPAACCQWLE